MKLSVNANISASAFPTRKNRSWAVFNRFRSTQRPGTPASRAYGSGGDKKRKLWRMVGLASGIIAGIAVLTLIIGGVVFASYLGKINAALPDPGNLPERTLEQSTQIFDRNGKLLYTVYGDQNRSFVALDKMPEQVKWSVLAAEDIDFYEHKGVDPLGIVAAGLGCIRGGLCRGASTIDQQLVRNTILVDVLGDEAYDRSLSRKLKELLITMRLDQQLSKDQILELYLNLIPLGGPNYGFQAAAKAYFNKDVANLTLAESAFLAGIIRQPTGLSPLTGGDPVVAKERRDQVLDLMHKYKERIKITVKDPATNKTSIRSITDEDINAAKAEELTITPGKIDIQAPHFVFYVIQSLEEKFGPDAVKTGGLRVTTSLDLGMQTIAQDQVTKDIKNFKNWYGTHNASLVAMNPKNGEILAMVGSVDYNNTKDKRVDGNVNIAITPRQQGSAVKSTTYLEAFARGYNPGTLVPDIQMSFGNYKPLDWDKKFQGPMSIRRALSSSRNVSAVYALQLIGGTDTFLSTAKKIGITTLNDPSRYGLSITLGAAEMKLLEHTNVYAMHANRGIQYPPTSILNVKDNKGKEIYKYEPDKVKKRIYSEQEVYLINWINCLIGTSADKLSAWAYSLPGQKLCGKTGTTDGPTDLTSFLYYPRLTVGVWAGNNNNKFTFGSRGQGWSTNVPIAINRNFISRVYKKMGSEWYSQPANITSGQVCRDTGLLASRDTDCQKEATIFISGHLPPNDDAHKKLPICRTNNKVATNEAEARMVGLIRDRLYMDFKLQNTAQQKAWETWYKKSKGLLYSEKPDAAECPLGLGQNNAPTVNISQPTNGANFQPGDSLTISGSVNALGISQVQIFYAGTSVFTGNTASFSHTMTVPGGTGNRTIRVVATDTSGRTGEQSVTINVNNPGTINVSLSANPTTVSAASGAVNFTTTLSGSVTPGTSVSVTVFDSSNNSVFTSVPDLLAPYTAAWDPATPGVYTAVATANSANGSFQSSPIAITVN